MAFGRKRRSHDDEFDGLYNRYTDHDNDDSIELGEHRFAPPTRRRRFASTVGCILPVAMLAALGFGGYYGYEKIRDSIGRNTCHVRSDGFDYQWTPEQAANAATITTIGTFSKQLPKRAAQIAITTAIQESKLRNLRSGDLDSLGLFQQRPSQGWGRADQILDPVFSTTSFYDHLVKVTDWQTIPVTQAAQAVQRSGYPSAYAAHETQGRVASDVFSGTVAEGVGCRLDAAPGHGDPAAVVTKLSRQSGLRASVSNGYLTFRGTAAQAQGVAMWAVAHAQSDNINSVILGDRAWNRESGRSGLTWKQATHPTSGSTEVRIEVA